MKELKVGMYVRTKNGMIAKIILKEDVSGSLHREEIVFILDNGNKLALHSKKVLKASHNIIDLIEENDFINGLRVEKNKYGELYTSYVYYGGGIGKQCEVYTTWLKEYTEDMIENIVTKEQFNSVKYEVE